MLPLRAGTPRDRRRVLCFVCFAWDCQKTLTGVSEASLLEFPSGFSLGSVVRLLLHMV